MKEYVFSGEQSGELCRSKSLVEIYHTSKDIKEFDRKNGIDDIYYYEVEIESDEKDEKGHVIVYAHEVKIYKRGRKVFCKRV